MSHKFRYGPFSFYQFIVQYNLDLIRASTVYNFDWSWALNFVQLNDNDSLSRNNCKAIFILYFYRETGGLQHLLTGRSQCRVTVKRVKRYKILNSESRFVITGPTVHSYWGPLVSSASVDHKMSLSWLLLSWQLPPPTPTPASPVRGQSQKQQG